MPIIALWQDSILCVIISINASCGTFNRTSPIERSEGTASFDLAY